MILHANDTTRKVFFIILLCVLVLLLLHTLKGNQQNDVQKVSPQIISRLENLDKSFHNFVALANKRTEAAYSDDDDDEELPLENPTETLSKPVNNPRWSINHTFYTDFLRTHQIQQKPSPKCAGKYKMLILVQSYITHRERRDSIRRTWGNSTASNPNYKWKTLFIIGRTSDKKHPPLLAEEMKIHNDLLLFSTGESFYNLTEKLQKSFQWIGAHCDFHYLLKCDDDIFVNVANLYTYLDQPRIPSTELFAGQMMWWSEVYRKGRYAIDKGYKRTVYPRYCSGGGYVLSRDVVLKFIDLFPRIPYMRIDDAYFGELALKAGLGIRHNPEFRMWTANCDWKKRSIIIHPVKNKKCMTDMYRKSFIDFAGIGI